MLDKVEVARNKCLAPSLLKTNQFCIAGFGRSSCCGYGECKYEHGVSFLDT
jgi:hypothetical protein